MSMVPPTAARVQRGALSRAVRSSRSVVAKTPCVFPWGRPNWIDYVYKSRWGCSILIPQGPPYYSVGLSPRKLDTIDHLYSPLSQGTSCGINGGRLYSLELVKPATYPITLPMRAPVANARRGY